MIERGVTFLRWKNINHSLEVVGMEEWRVKSKGYGRMISEREQIGVETLFLYLIELILFIKKWEYCSL